MPRKSNGEHCLAALAVTVLVSIAVLSSCASKQVDASVPTTPSTVAASPTAAAPLSVPQTQVVLPPAQPVPEAAIPPRPTTTAVMGPIQPTPEPPPPTAAPQPTVQRVQTPPPPTAVPQLGRLLTGAQTRAYNRVISENVLAARGSLDLLARMRLTANQRQEVERVRAFLLQADEARGRDLELARSLSDRARLLAEDMVRNVPR